MKRISIIVILLLLFVCTLQMQAQDKRKKKEDKTAQKQEDEPTPTFNYVVDDPLDAFGPKGGDTTPAIRYFLYPEFYTYWPTAINDTTLKYECYDINHNPLNMDTLQKLNDVYFVSFIKTYNDYLQTLIDQEGKPRPQPVGKVLYRYERTGADKWKAFDIQNNYTSLLQEQTGKITRSDTTILANPVTGTKQTTIRKYYKVVEIEKDNVETIGQTIPNTIDPSKTSVSNYYVPEFYFREPKKIKDTILEFLCYDKRDSVIPVVTNFDSVNYFSLFKKFDDATHTYTDNGQKKPLPVSVIIKRYDRAGAEKWISVEYPGNKFTNLKGFKNNIVSSDTVVVSDPVTDHTTLKVYNYYKVIKN